MQDEIELQTPAQWKAVSHPLRVGILRLLVDKPHTNEELADALNVASGKLYFHTKRLLDAGLIVLDSTRQKGPLTEKLYTAVARTFTAPRSSTPPIGDGSEAAPLAGLIETGLHFYEATWKDSGGLPDDLHYGFSLLMPQSPAKRREFVTRLRDLFADFKDNDGAENEPDARAVSLTVLMHSVPPSLIPVSLSETVSPEKE